MGTMSQKARLLDVFEGHRHLKVILAVSIMVVLFLEILIYLTAASQTGDKSNVVITDSDGRKVFETAGTALSAWEKMNFENTHGPLQNFVVQIHTETHAFPFRAWLLGAVGVPIGLILLMAFLVRAFLSLLYGEEKGKQEKGSASDFEGRYGSIFQFFGRISVFHIGFLVAVSVVLLWVVPNFLGDFAQGAVGLIREFRWFFLGAGIFTAVLVVWVIYLRYKLSKRMLDNQLDLEKYRVQLITQDERPLLTTTPMSEVREN